MESIRTLVEGIANRGRITKKVKIGDVDFVVSTLTSEEIILTSSINGLDEIRDVIKDKSLQTYDEGFLRMKTITLVSFCVVEIGGNVIHKPDDSIKERYENAKEFRKELLKMPPEVIDILGEAYKKVAKEQKEAFKDIKEFVGK